METISGQGSWIRLTLWPNASHFKPSGKVLFSSLKKRLVDAATPAWGLESVVTQWLSLCSLCRVWTSKTQQSCEKDDFKSMICNMDPLHVCHCCTRVELSIKKPSKRNQFVEKHSNLSKHKPCQHCTLVGHRTYDFNSCHVLLACSQMQGLLPQRRIGCADSRNLESLIASLHSWAKISVSTTEYSQNQDVKSWQ